MAVAVVTVAGCVNVRYDDEHADRNTRNYLIAARMNRTFKTIGMVGVTGDIEDCYREATTPPIKRFALQDCLSYDYAAYQFDATMGRLIFRGMRTPYFENAAALARWRKFGKLDGFGDPSEIAAYLRMNNGPIYQDLQRIPGSVFYAVSPRGRPQKPNGSF